MSDHNPANSLNLYKRIFLLLPPYIEKETCFINILDRIISLAEFNAMPLESYSYGHAALLIETHLKKIRSPLLHNFYSFIEEKEVPEAKMTIRNDDLLAIVSPQRESLLYSKTYNVFLKKILKNAGENGYLIIYPGVSGSKNRAY